MSGPAFDGSQPGSLVGHFTYTVADDAWEWSDGLFELHGFAPNEVPASTGVMLSHKHPDDRTRTYEVLEAVARDGEPFSCYHRIIDRHQRVRSVLSVGRGEKDGDGTVVRVVGFFVDLTEVRRTETNADVEVALARIAEHRAVIEQAKGIVMLATGCDADSAFRELRRASQNANVKLHEVAARLVAACGSTVRGGDDTRRALRAFLLGLRPAVERTAVPVAMEAQQR